MANLSEFIDDIDARAQVEANKRAEKGAALLDCDSPNWSKMIHIQTLYVSRSSCCPLKQIYGGYTRGKAQLGLNSESVGEHGFNCLSRDDVKFRQAWDDQILQRIGNHRRPGFLKRWSFRLIRRFLLIFGR